MSEEVSQTEPIEVEVSKPFPNEHAARQTDPGQYKSFRRFRPEGWPAGVDAILGIREDGKSEIQSIRFNAKQWTPEKARQWLKDHDFKTSLEVASGAKKSEDEEPEGESVATEKSIHIPISKVNEEKRIVTGVVLQPEVVDGQGDIVSEEVIEQAAHNFLMKYVKARARLGYMHEDFTRKLELVELYVAPVSFELGGRPVKKGSWLMSVHVVDEAVWQDVKTKRINGFSIKGMARAMQLAA